MKDSQQIGVIGQAGTADLDGAVPDAARPYVTRFVHVDARHPRLVLGAIGLLVVAATVYSAHAMFGLEGEANPHLWNHWVYDAIIGGSAAVCLWRAFSIRNDRGAWLAIGFGIALFWLGDLYWNNYLADLSTPPYPSWADAGWLAYYVPMYVGLMLILHRRVAGLPLSMWLEGVVGALALASVCATVVFDPLATATHGDLGTIATNLAYPAADLLLAVIIAAGFALQRERSSMSWVLLGAGVVLFAVGDCVYIVKAATNTYVEGTWIDATWPFAMVLAATAAWAHDGVPIALEGAGWVGRTLSICFGSLVIAVLLLQSVHGMPLVSRFLIDGAVVALIGRLLISSRERAQLERTRHEARTDELTGLANRRRFYEETELALATGPVGLLLLDLNRFKEINDSLGHNSGDELLRDVAERLSGVLPPGGEIARIGGDEFVVLLDSRHNERSALRAARVFREALEMPFTLDGFHAPMTASIGIALAPAHATTRAELLRCADVAMYIAKTHDTAIELYRPENDTGTADRLRLVTELNEALGRGQLMLHYQPKISLADGGLEGVEALVRWQHPRLGLLAPDLFVPLAEQHGLMRALTMEVLDQALRQQLRWREVGRAIPVAVNLSPSNLLDTRLPEDVTALLSHHGIAAELLELEITEETLMRDVERGLDVLARLSESGIELALDDFGTGYSSLGQLRRLPVRELKIDRSFVMQILASSDDAAIVRSTIQLGRSLGLHVVAEGVESAAHLDLLRSYGCHAAQGYHIGRPMPADALEHWFAERLSTRADVDGGSGAAVD